MKFTKMHGIGNDYVYINCFEETVDNPKDLAIKMSNRNFGIGSDGLILIKPGEKAPIKMDMYNSDGSWSEMCGNGLRCVAKYVYDRGMIEAEEFAVETGAGILKVNVFPKNGLVESVEINMGKPTLKAKDIPINDFSDTVINQKINILDKTFFFTGISMGNPHCVIFLENEDIDNFNLRKYGPLIENHLLFPNRINVEFVKVISSKEVIQRTWERGSGETLACGTGASAVQVAGVLNNKTENTILIHLRGGDLYLKWDDNKNVYLRGPAVKVFDGEWKLDY